MTEMNGVAQLQNSGTDPSTWQWAGPGSQRPFAPAPQPSCPAPDSAFRVLGSAPEKPAGLLDRERPKTGKYCLLTLRPPFDRVASCFVSPKTNSPSPAQRSVRAGAQKANSYQLSVQANKVFWAEANL